METEFLHVVYVKVDKNGIFFEKNEYYLNFSILNGFYVDNMQKFSFQSIPGAFKPYIHRNWAVLREKMGSKLSFSKPGLKNSIPEKPPKCYFK